MDSDDAARPGAAERIRWAPRVNREKLRRLYQGAARGILDAVLLDEIGTTIYCRCRDILIVSDAAEGRVVCPRCSGAVTRDRRDDPNRNIECGGCGRTMRWRDHQRSYQHQELYARGLTEAIGEFVSGWERAEKPRDKMMLIDRLIHIWRWETSRYRQKGRPAAVNLIEGSRRQVPAFLDELAAVAAAR